MAAIIAYDEAYFTWKGNDACAEASELPGSFGEELAIRVGGTVWRYKHLYTERDREGDVRAWVYSRQDGPSRITIFND